MSLIWNKLKNTSCSYFPQTAFLLFRFLILPLIGFLSSKQFLTPASRMFVDLLFCDFNDILCLFFVRLVHKPFVGHLPSISKIKNDENWLFLKSSTKQREPELRNKSGFSSHHSLGEKTFDTSNVLVWLDYPGGRKVTCWWYWSSP